MYNECPLGLFQMRMIVPLAGRLLWVGSCLLTLIPVHVGLLEVYDREKKGETVHVTVAVSTDLVLPAVRYMPVRWDGVGWKNLARRAIAVVGD